MDPVIGLIFTNYTSAGFGSLLEDRCFASLPFGGRYRLIDFALSNMVNSGIRTVGLITPRKYRSLLDHVGIGTEWGLSRKIGGLFLLPGTVYGFTDERGKFLLRDILVNREYIDRDSADYILLCASNKIYNMDYTPMIRQHIESGVDCTLLYKPVIDADQSIGPYLQFDDLGEVTGYTLSSPEGGNRFMDCMIINKSLLYRIMDGFAEMGHLDLLSLLLDHINQLRLGSYPFYGYLGCVDSIQDYVACSRDLFDRSINRELFWSQNRIFTKVQDSAPAKYLPGSRVTNSYISSGCQIEGTVENSILFRKVHVKKGAVVRNCIIMQRCNIGEHAFMENVICDKFVTISSHVTLTGTPDNSFLVEKHQKF